MIGRVDHVAIATPDLARAASRHRQTQSSWGRDRENGVRLASVLAIQVREPIWRNRCYRCEIASALFVTRNARPKQIDKLSE